MASKIRVTSGRRWVEFTHPEDFQKGRPITVYHHVFAASAKNITVGVSKTLTDQFNDSEILPYVEWAVDFLRRKRCTEHNKK